MRDDERLLTWEGDKVDGVTEGKQVVDMDGMRAAALVSRDGVRVGCDGAAT